MSPRPSHNLDQKLLDAGRSIIEEEGLSRLSLRAVAKRAGVNLGMFHYYFRNKEEFSRRCTSDAYAEFYKGFESETAAPGDTVTKLRRGLMALARFSRDQRHFVLAMLRDLESKSPEAWNFMKSRFPPPHAKVISALIQQGQQEGVLIKVPLHGAMSVVMSAIAFPSLMGGLAERVVGTRLLNLPKLAIKHYFLSDKVIQLRVELALRALLKEPPKELATSRRLK
jgi:AcrR family transcriptional regulator